MSIQYAFIPSKLGLTASSMVVRMPAELLQKISPMVTSQFLPYWVRAVLSRVFWPHLVVQPKWDCVALIMTAKTKTSEYLLLFRGTNWPKDLSPEEIQWR